jgi:hypothetical protein
MILTADIEFNLIINDMNEYYNAESDEALVMYYVKTNYEKSCYQNQFIIEFVSVVKHSQPEIVNKDLSAKIRIYAVVRAKVIKYDMLDIVTGMKVSQIINKGKIRNQDMMECRNDHCISLMILDQRMKIGDDYPFNIGDIINVKVGNASYMIGKPNITVAAYPFITHEIENSIFCIQPLEDEDKTYLTQNIIPIYTDLLKKKQTMEGEDAEFKDRVKYFTSLLYPFKKDKRKEIKSSDLKNVLDLSDSGFVSASKVHMDSELKMVVYHNVDTSATTVINDHAINVYQKMIIDAIKQLSVIIDMATLYKDPTAFEKHTYLFDMYEASKM